MSIKNQAFKINQKWDLLISPQPQLSQVDTISEFFYIQSPIKQPKPLMVCGERGDRFC